MADNLPPVPTPPAETGTPNTVTNINGGVNLDAQHDANITGDVVGRDKVTNNIDTGGGAVVKGDVNADVFIGRDIITTNVTNNTVVPRDKNLRVLLEKVGTFWVEGVLENSVHHAALIELGKQVKADAVEVDHPWETVVWTADKPDRTLPPEAKIIDVFDEMQGALLILGEPGSGKTTMLLELARDLMACAEKDTTLPVPVVFNLSSWAEKRQALAEWLVDELKAKYGASSKIGRQWVEKNNLILLLDGLDEVKSELRQACIEAINRFHVECGMTGIVVCSRTAEYEVLTSRLKLNSAVVVQPLTRDQVDRYIDAGGAQLAALGSALRMDVALRELAEVPLTLSIMSVAYGGQPGADLNSVSDDTTQRRKQLFSAYVDKMFARDVRTERKSYPKGDTVRWLAWLASKMSEYGQTVFLIEQLQPRWLQSRVQQRGFAVRGKLHSTLDIGDICLVESLEVSWSKLVVEIRTRLGIWLAIGITLGVILGLLLSVDVVGDTRFLTRLEVGLSLGLTTALFRDGLLIGIAFGIELGIISGLKSGLSVKQMKTKTKPNQGIWQSGRNALFVGLILGLIVLPIFGLVGGLVGKLLGSFTSGLVMGLASGLVLVLLYGLQFGGLAFIQHFVLRLVLWRNDYIPFNYVRFLDNAAERIFLRKVGGGYIFIHRMLMEYFASLETQPSAEGN